MAFSATTLGVPITPIYGFGNKRWKGYECLSGPCSGLGTVYKQYVPPAMEPGVVVSMAHLIPQPEQVFVRGQGPFNGLGYTRYSTVQPFHEGPVVRRMAKQLDVPMMAGTDSKTTLKKAALTIGIAGVALVVGGSAIFWFVREMAEGSQRNR